MRSLLPCSPLALASLGALFTALAGLATFAPDWLPFYGVQSLLPALALLGPVLILLGGAWALWQAVTLVRRGGGWSGVATWAGWAWLSGPLLLLGCALLLARAGDFGFTVSGPSESYTFYYPNTRAAQWAAAAELLTLWLGPALGLLWLGRRLDA